LSQIYKPLTSTGPIPPDIATTYQANTGTATPASNILNVLGINGATTTASGNTINISPGFATTQFVSSTVLKTAPITLTRNVSVTITSITLQPGNWSISAVFEAGDTIDASIVEVDLSISTVNNTLTGVYGLSNFNEILNSGNESYNTSIPAYQVSIVAPTTYYMVVSVNFNGGSCVGYGTISAIGQLASGGSGVTFPILVSQGGTGLTSTTANQLLYSSSNSVIAGLATANNGVLITSATGVPSILPNGTTGQVLTATTGSPPSWQSSSGGVTSITGTANQLTASASTGAITLSIPSTFIAPGSIEVTTTLKSDGIFTTASGQVVKITTPGAYPYTTLTTDFVILVDTTSARTIIPLGSPTTGTMYRIKDNVGSAAANNITITPSGKNIDGVASFTINNNYGAVDIVYNGTQWNVL
jgi:hypothetical protein